ncbi:MAG: kinase/pyrophosphorylase [Firmicutes bacterium]|nr:kinase/pyrophosphorylase [Bacillota bacterium]
MAAEVPVIYIISDSIGDTAEVVARAAASQFDSGKFEIRRVPYVSDEKHLEEIIAEVQGCNCAIIYTVVVPELKQALEKLVKERNIPAVDILGPAIDAIGKISQLPPKLKPGLLRQLDEMYFHRVEAIEFAVRYDDGKDPRGLALADIVLIGVSRTSKTPLSMYLANKRLKVANVPLVPEVAPPEELFKLPPNKIIGLTIKPQLLNEIRQERLKTLGLTSSANYASLERIEQELDYAAKLMKRLGCPVIDVTNKAVEETAAKILEIYYKGERYGG